MANILCVDDSPTDLHYLVQILTNAGHQVITATNAKEGIDAATSKKPALIFQDIVMPDGDNGFQAIRKLRQNEASKDIPIVIVSTKGQETDKIWGMRQGAARYLVKPVKADEVLAAVNELVA